MEAIAGDVMHEGRQQHSQHRHVASCMHEDKNGRRYSTGCMEPVKRDSSAPAYAGF